MKEDEDNLIDENCSIILIELDKEEEKEDTVKIDFHILKFAKEESELIEDVQEEIDDTSFP